VGAEKLGDSKQKVKNNDLEPIMQQIHAFFEQELGQDLLANRAKGFSV